jgi:hypothetical protein
MLVARYREKVRACIRGQRAEKDVDVLSVCISRLQDGMLLIGFSFLGFDIILR